MVATKKLSSFVYTTLDFYRFNSESWSVATSPLYCTFEMK